MNKTEQSLVDAIEAKDYDLALEKFEAFQSLKSTTDEQANDYFNKIESLKDSPVVEVAAKVEDTPEEIEAFEEELRIETRGRKAKNVERKALEDGLNELIENALLLNAKRTEKTPSDALFARRLARRLIIIRKQVVR